MHIREVGLLLCSTPLSFLGGDDCSPLETDTLPTCHESLSPVLGLSMLDGAGNLLQRTLNSDG